MKQVRLVLSVLVATAVATTSADVITLRDGRKQAGLVTSNLPDEPTVSIQTSNGNISIPRAKIVNVEIESKQASYARLGDQYLDGGDFNKAADAYRAALQSDPNSEEITAKLNQAINSIADAKQDEHQQALDKVDDLISSSLALAKKTKFTEAIEALKASDPGEQSPKAAAYRSAYSQIYYLWGVDRADHQDMNGASDKLQLALKFDSNNEPARILIAKTWEGNPAKLKEMAEYYKNSTSIEDRMKLADALFKLRDYDQALPLYLSFLQEPKIATDVMRDRVRLMYDMIHRKYAEQGDFEKALASYKAFLEFSPNEDKSVLAKYDYMIRRSKTDLNDPDSRAQLAQYAAENGMTETARKEFINILSIAPNNALAKQGLEQFAADDLQEIQDLFSEGQYLLTIQKCKDVGKIYESFPKVVTIAQEWQTKAGLELQKSERSSQDQAVALAQRGDQYYNQAVGYLSTLVSTEVNAQNRAFSPKSEAAKYFQRAILSWREALRIQPSLGDPATYDLRRKINDATAQYNRLVNPVAPRLPRDSRGGK